MYKRIFLKFLIVLSSLFIIVSNVASVSAATGKDSFYFNLDISINQGVRKSGGVTKLDYASYGAATVNYHDLVSTDQVYIRILRPVWNNANHAATGYSRVTGYGTYNMYYNSGETRNGSTYVLEGDSDKHVAQISGIWEP